MRLLRRSHVLSREELARKEEAKKAAQREVKRLRTNTGEKA